MSQEPINAPHVTTASQGGGKKWLIGAAAAAVVFGGGFLAWKTNGAGAPELQVAANDAAYQADEAPVRAGPLPPLAEPAAIEARAAPARSARVQTAQAEPAPRRAAMRDETVAEEVVGVVPVSADEGFIVEGARRPVWTRTPSARRLSAVYPDRALERGREGEASVQCVVQENGALDCVRGAEMPANSGFGRAALRVAHMYRHAPQRADGSTAVGMPVNLRVVFRIAEDARTRS